MYQAALKYYNQRAGIDLTLVKVFFLVPTGKASNNIKGDTIHNALGISAFHSLKTYLSLDSSTLNTLKWELPHLLVYKSTFYDQKISAKNHPRLIHETNIKSNKLA